MGHTIDRCIIRSAIRTCKRHRRMRSHQVKMQEPQEYAQSQFSEERRQRVSQAKKRFNCYTENIVIEWPLCYRTQKVVVMPT